MDTVTTDLADLHRLRETIAASDTSARLAQVDAQIVQVQAAIQAQKDAERQAALSVAVEAMNEAEQATIDIVYALNSQLETLQAARERVAAYGGQPSPFAHWQRVRQVTTWIVNAHKNAQPQVEQRAGGSVWANIVSQTTGMMNLGRIKR